jgi:eukaryotic-like serine/threonine-protein kinase
MELEVLGDRYELQEPIGRGGMATIYRAVDLRMGRTVAVKILREVYSSDPKFVTRFQREARAASALQHPNIVQVFDYGQTGPSYYIVMEFVDGTDLRRYIKKHGVLSNERAIEIAHDVALGLGAAHKRGIVHRDVKPQNIMLNDSGLVKLTDFGIASMYKDAEAERLTTTGMTLGTVQYYAPEQAQGEIVSPPADIYALGIVLYEMLTGRTPFDGDTPVAVAMRHIQDAPEPPSNFNPRITPGLERIILRCLEKDPRDRFRDGDALAYALENVARAPAGRRGATGVSVPTGRPQFAPLGLPANEPRQGPGSGPAAYGGAAVMNGPGPGVTRVPSGPPGGPRSMTSGVGYDEPTYQGFNSGPDGGIGTRPYGPAPGTVPRSPTPSWPSGPHGAPGGGRKRNGPLVAVVVSSVVLLLGLSCFLVASLTGLTAGLGSLLGGATPTATVVTVPVPNFVGEQLTAAQAQAANSHLNVTPNFVADNHPKGLVLQQDPVAGTPEPINYTVTLTVSNGPNKIQIPNVLNLPIAQALQRLADVNLTNIAPPVNMQSTLPAGYVIKTDPPPGSYVLPTDKITIYVSIGPPTPTPSPSPTATATATPSPTP